ncbi:hypothetical protein PN451_09575 [Dolichospermum planctonicum CS-1226]|uniref:Uncharacterized protein n=1 Tax=Dolichospermum planctonicum CS-1226 TaxID=3021751 RepID=A0ABT5AGT7_9CYAN|nr:hypothetical protein [Dolichospermum planctonicum]MDB9536079.1 hypothetical protein [Dolichospermum planctonicum CS-1226]
MTIFSLDELKNLVQNPHYPCVSLYLPVERLGGETRQNPIRFKNLIREAEKRLDEIGLRPTESVNLLKPAMELDNIGFWENQNQGLVIFSSPNLFRYYCLPISFPQLAIVGKNFHIKPLLELINNDGKFYILALSQNHVKFYSGTRYKLDEIAVENMPENLEETLLEDEFQKGVQHRVGTPRSVSYAAQQPGSVHGQGSSDREKHEREILNFCYAVDTALHEILRDEKAPLILAGVDYLLPIYQKANTYPHFLETGITGNVELMKTEELNRAAWEIVSPLFQQEYEDIMGVYLQLAGEESTKITNDIKTIIPAAYYQRVDTLFVPLKQHIWGKFDLPNATVELHPEPAPDDEDMLDFAVIHTILNGGRVYTLEPEAMPSGVKVAAICRY